MELKFAIEGGGEVTATACVLDIAFRVRFGIPVSVRQWRTNRSVCQRYRYDKITPDTVYEVYAVITLHGGLCTVCL